jgi:hypothetical protein
MKRILLLTILGTVFVTLAGGASATPGAALVIRHQLRGCHAWSLNGGAYKPTQHITIHRGGSLVVTNNDVMPHQLVKVAGPALAMKLIKIGGMGVKAHGTGMMSHMGATLKVTFLAKGVYRLTTKAGEDYMKMAPTIGEDNVLRAVVTVV